MPFTPIILVTAKAGSKDVVAGLEAGADEYLTKPIDQTALVARVKSVLRIKQLHDQVRAQADELASWNKTLEQRVEQQLGEIERVSRLRRFLSPQIADAILSDGDDKVLEKPPARHHGRVLRSARLHPVCRKRGAGGADRHAARLPRAAGRACPQVRGHRRTLHRRWVDDLVQ